MLYRKIIITILLNIAAFCSLHALNLSQMADSAYQAGNFHDAAVLYQKVIDTEGTSSDIYLNLGNSYYRCGKQAQAILAYERALRIDPANIDARFNLEFVNQRIQDDKGETGTFLSNTLDSAALYLHSNTWAWIGLAFIVLAALGIVLYYFNNTIIVKKLGFFGAILTLILSIVALSLSFKASALAKDSSYAIITAPTTMLSTVPRAPMGRAEEAMLLHEGTKVKILRSISISADSASQTWSEVEIDNKHQAWINADDIEKIVP